MFYALQPAHLFGPILSFCGKTISYIVFRISPGRSKMWKELWLLEQLLIDAMTAGIRVELEREFPKGLGDNGYDLPSVSNPKDCKGCKTLISE